MAISIKGSSGSEVIELEDGQSAGLSSASTVRMRANATTGNIEFSAFGGAYASPGGSVDLPADGTTYSFARNLYAGGTNASMGSAASFTQGVAIAPVQERTITGVRFWCNLSSSVDFKASLWNTNTGARLADGTAAVPTGDGFYEVLFSTPYSFVSSDLGREFRVTLYHVSGTAYPRATSNNYYVPAIPFVAGVYVQDAYSYFASGDAFPSSVAGSEYYMIEPVFQKVTA